MTSSDVRDVLNLEAHAGPRPAKKQKTPAPRLSLKGLAREVQNLGGDNPIAIVPEASIFKKRRIASRKPAAKWELRVFQNSARGDGGSLILKHWRRKTDGPGAGATEPQEGERVKSEETKRELEDSAFAKFNVRVDVPQYSDDQYQTNLVNPDWTKDETDYLLNLVKEYDLRWPIIWDRYDYVPEAINGESSADGDESKAIIPAPKPRSMEDLKARYYEIAAKMMAAQTPVQYMTKEECALHETMAKFNPAQERLRKEFAINGMTRTKEEANEEESLLVEIKRILQRSAVFNEERRELYNRLDYPHTDQDISSFKSSSGLQTLLQTMMAVDKNKKRKSLMGADGASPSAPGNKNSGANAASTPTEKTGGKKGQQQQQQQQQPQPQPQQQQQQQQQQQPQERRKLSEAEKYIYGVSYHDRLPPGPTFRYERINKLFTNKSGQQQIRISNLLTELDVPPRLTMPTAAVTAQFEQLMGAVSSLLDARKVTDKIDAEIKVELAKKTEREERERKKNPPRGSAESAKGTGANDTNPEKDGSGKEAKTTAKQSDINDGEWKETAASGEDKAQAEKAGGSEPNGASHKRSASVLSTVSDKSAKRQRK
ncbi:SWR1-complex protein 4 [Sodiomyces alkalinus F11]|uniref:SWR1-complex protein 4 n=1 Tax=Sodiomyces alkalinus (strain CBS 110278 / VKM F-3762 / F11) TaxID=1314773 RepID=A0A3N2PML4_SODAK|nr:SWR1-complex protein 4 [Sodiomyces alkalinus F11]ROT35654.1 SWR1-complex protein 4 [Sodiomyces alkalinus F11]